MSFPLYYNKCVQNNNKNLKKIGYNKVINNCCCFAICTRFRTTYILYSLSTMCNNFFLRYVTL